MVSAEATARRDRALRRRRQIAIRRTVALCGVLFVLVIAVGLAFAGSAGRIPGGTKIAGIDVSGLSASEAATRLEGVSEKLSHAPVLFHAGDASLSLSASQLGVDVHWQRAVEEALRAGNGFGPLRGIRRLGLQIGGRDVQPRVDWYRSAVSYSLEQLAAKVDRKPVAARLRRTATGEFSIVVGHGGVVLDRRRATEKMIAALSAPKRPGRVDLPVVDRAAPVSVGDLATALRQARAAVSAPVRLTLGSRVVRLEPHQLSAFLRLPAGGGRDVHLGGRKAERWLRHLAASAGRAPRDAGWNVVDGGKVQVTPDVPGVLLDMPRTVERLEKAAFAPGRRTAALAVRDVRASRSTADAKKLGIREVVSGYTTTYAGTPGRLHNVQLVARLVDGALIAPGDTFSFNDVTGERNASKGFEEAQVIINGELQTGIGGGVCQVSTTIYNAAFEAGLPIADRTNHALYIDHYPLGRDATVNYPDIDLKFRNDTDGWLVVRTFIGEGSLTVKLLGRSPHRRVEAETTPLTVVGKTPFQVIRDPTLYRGTRYAEKIGTHPRQTSVRRKVYDADGKLISDTMSYSRYPGEPTIVRLGTKQRVRPSTPAPAPAPSAPAAAASAPALPVAPPATEAATSSSGLTVEPTAPPASPLP